MSIDSHSRSHQYIAMKILILIVGIFNSLQLYAGDCLDRIGELKAPLLPTSLQVQHTLVREGACTVEIEFSLSDEGEVLSAEPYVAEERCEGLHRSAIKALKNSQFNEGENIEGCIQNFTFRIDENT